MERILTHDTLTAFRQTLQADEHAPATITKYLHDIKAFLHYAEDAPITKPLVIAYKQDLLQRYQVTTANSMLAALNRFFKFCNWTDCTVKPFKVQQDTFRPEHKNLTKAEYVRLLDVAKHKNQLWLYHLMLTLCATGIRVSELPFITVQAVCTRQAIIRNKGKTRRVILPVDLCRKLTAYAKAKGITHGSIFVTRNGKPIDRSNIHHAMKQLCAQAEVQPSKVFPHNLRHLFAVSYYNTHHDLSGLACVLGHTSINTTRIYTATPLEEKVQFINDLQLVI